MKRVSQIQFLTNSNNYHGTQFGTHFHEIRTNRRVVLQTIWLAVQLLDHCLHQMEYVSQMLVPHDMVHGVAGLGAGAGWIRIVNDNREI